MVLREREAPPVSLPQDLQWCSCPSRSGCRWRSGRPWYWSWRPGSWLSSSCSSWLPPWTQLGPFWFWVRSLLFGTATLWKMKYYLYFTKKEKEVKCPPVDNFNLSRNQDVFRWLKIDWQFKNREKGRFNHWHLLFIGIFYFNQNKKLCDIAKLLWFFGNNFHLFFYCKPLCDELLFFLVLILLKNFNNLNLSGAGFTDIFSGTINFTGERADIINGFNSFFPGAEIVVI